MVTWYRQSPPSYKHLQLQPSLLLRLPHHHRFNVSFFIFALVEKDAGSL